MTQALAGRSAAIERAASAPGRETRSLSRLIGGCCRAWGKGEAPGSEAHSGSKADCPLFNPPQGKLLPSPTGDLYLGRWCKEGEKKQSREALKGLLERESARETRPGEKKGRSLFFGSCFPFCVATPRPGAKVDPERLPPFAPLNMPMELTQSRIQKIWLPPDNHPALPHRCEYRRALGMDGGWVGSRDAFGEGGLPVHVTVGVQKEGWRDGWNGRLRSTRAGAVQKEKGLCVCVWGGLCDPHDAGEGAEEARLLFGEGAPMHMTLRSVPAKAGSAWGGRGTSSGAEAALVVSGSRGESASPEGGVNRPLGEQLRPAILHISRAGGKVRSGC